MTTEQKNFVDKIAPLIQKYAPLYGILVNSPIIAQAIIESAWGESELSKLYHNYFGMKTGTLWKGKSVNMTTGEEYTVGTITTIKDNFRVYDSMEDGVKGYFEFIQLARYQNLKGITDPRTYLQTIKNDGYATSSKYVDNLMNVINVNNLTVYDSNNTVVVATTKRTNQDYISVFRSWVGWSEANGKHRAIVDLYNSYLPLPSGYKVKYTDSWCDVTVSAAGIKAGMVDLINRECGCQRHIELFKSMDIWIEDGTILPKPGYIILYNWDDNIQPNDGFADHIGVVESVTPSGLITCIEGNYNDAVGRRVISKGNGNIRGYATPRYDVYLDENNNTVSNHNVVTNNTNPTQTVTSTAISKVIKYQGIVNALELNVRKGAGISYARLISYPSIKKGTIVDVCDVVKDSNGDPWYYIRINGNQGYKYGFVSAEYISKVTNNTNTISSSDTNRVLNKTPTYVGVVTSDTLNVRTWAGTSYGLISGHPVLGKGNYVDVCDAILAADGSPWFYVRIEGKYYGFVKALYIAKVE